MFFFPGRVFPFQGISNWWCSFCFFLKPSFEKAALKCEGCLYYVPVFAATLVRAFVWGLRVEAFASDATDGGHGKLP